MEYNSEIYNVAQEGNEVHLSVRALVNLHLNKLSIVDTMVCADHRRSCGTCDKLGFTIARELYKTTMQSDCLDPLQLEIAALVGDAAMKLFEHVQACDSCAKKFFLTYKKQRRSVTVDVA